MAILEPGAFGGESCRIGSMVRTETAIPEDESCLVRIHKNVMIRLLHEESTVSELFLPHLLSRNMRIQKD